MRDRWADAARGARLGGLGARAVARGAHLVLGEDVEDRGGVVHRGGGEVLGGGCPGEVADVRHVGAQHPRVLPPGVTDGRYVQSGALVGRAGDEDWVG
jgi:hypothetical protein